jgi:phospholipase C
MDSRRDFIRKAVLVATAGGGAGGFPEAIQRALAIEPDPGSTYLDAEHVVILMQENRSFDHCYGSLRGVRGFNDPRAITLPDGNPVWLQTNAASETFAPFRLNIKETNATWMGCLPHNWVDQSCARNGGRHDRWLDFKASGHRSYASMPLTLGYYTREDIPFYYALADAFTVCDQSFCSSLTPTTPNRLHLWAGTVRPELTAHCKAHIRNSDADHDTQVSFKTFPERLEELGISWCVYQNELELPTGFSHEAQSWLANFGDNPLEYFTQYHVWFSQTHRAYLQRRFKELLAELERLDQEPRPWTVEVALRASKVALRLDKTRRDLEQWTEQAFARLSPLEQALHRKAFTTNEKDPHYRELETVVYQDGATERQMQVPKGDLFFQFRDDVQNDRLPAVSWMVAPRNFSDHPDSPWYGAWYIAEVLDILTKNPAVWKKTIFILCYDENDGYFDHIPPFVAPHPDRPESGRASAGIDTSVEHVRPEQEEEHRQKYPKDDTHAGPIGLGYRVPLVIASPWSRGGYVCSQVFDHTSILQFLEKFLSHKTGRRVLEPNINAWRRTVCGDLTSVFRAHGAANVALPARVERMPFLRSIHQAQFRQLPNTTAKLTADEIAVAREAPRNSPRLPRQEPGSRPSCALPYELEVQGSLGADRRLFVIQFGAGRELFGARAAGAPFYVYAPGRTRVTGSEPAVFESGRNWAYAVSAGDRLSDSWRLDDFEGGLYHLRVHGPNGFFREFRGGADDPGLEILANAPRGATPAPGELTLHLVNRDGTRPLTVIVDDLSYGNPMQSVAVGPADSEARAVRLALPVAASFGWYDVRIRVREAPQFEQRFAGRVETGQEGVCDPLIG